MERKGWGHCSGRIHSKGLAKQPHDRNSHRVWRNFRLIGTHSIDLADHVAVAGQRREDKFLTERRKRLAKAMNALVKSLH